MKLIESAVQDLSTNARICEYNCSCSLLKGNIEEAKKYAKRGKMFRQAFYEALNEYLEEYNERYYSESH